MNKTLEVVKNIFLLIVCIVNAALNFYSNQIEFGIAWAVLSAIFIIIILLDILVDLID